MDSDVTTWHFQVQCHWRTGELTSWYQIGPDWLSQERAAQCIADQQSKDRRRRDRYRIVEVQTTERVVFDTQTEGK